MPLLSGFLNHQERGVSPERERHLHLARPINRARPQYFTSCGNCQKPIERKYALCYRCRGAKRQEPAKDLPEPAMKRKPQDHVGRPTYSNL